MDNTNDLAMKTDADGFRRKKAVSGGTDSRFLYDLASSQTPGLAPVVAEYNGSGVLQAKYHSGAAGLLAMMRTGGTIRWYLCDAVGSVRKLAESNGGITDNYLMDAWGNLIASTGSTANPFRYIGRENYYSDPDDLPDLMLLGVRYYSSSLGRFITPDPIGLKSGDYNLYRYVKDGPVNGTDPSGNLDGTATYYSDVGTAGCQVVKGATKKCPRCPKGESCFKQVYLTKNVTGVAATNALDPKFNCYDVVLVEDYDPKTKKKSGRQVTVTIVDTGGGGATHWAPGVIIDLRPKDLMTLTGKPLTGKGSQTSADVIATRTGHGWPGDVPRISWASNHCKTRENRPAQECE